MLARLWADLQRATVLLWHALRLALALLLSHWRKDRPPAVLIRIALQDLGITGVKMGQFLALRSDLLPVEVCRELGKLFEDASPMNFRDVQSVIESELGEPLENLFAEFQILPIAAASISQVHEARSRDGERVAVKVQRPNLERVFNADMRNLRRIGTGVDALHLAGQLSLVELADEFARFTRRELDFITEGETAERLRASAVTNEIVPRILWSLSSRRVLTMEFIEGVSMRRATALLAAGQDDELSRLLPDLDLSRALHNLAFAVVHQLLVSGFFHADPHPGNIVLCSGNRIAFLDFGIFGDVSPMQREVLARYIEEISAGNLDEGIRYFARVFSPTERTDLAAFQREARAVLGAWYESAQSPDGPFRKRMVAGFADVMFTVVRHQNLRINIDTLLFWRCMIVLDAAILQLSPGFDLLGELRDFFAEYRPGTVDRLIEVLTPERSLTSMLQLAANAPGRVDEILSRLVSGRFELSVTVRDSPQMRRSEDRRAGAISFSLVGFSLLLLARASTGVIVRNVVWGVALICFVSSLWRWRK
jgi:ubiquinone biosynthesis protein